MKRLSFILIILVQLLFCGCSSQQPAGKSIENIQGKRFSNKSIVKASIDFVGDSIAYFHEAAGCFGPAFGLTYYKVSEDTIYLTSLSDEELKNYAKTDSSHLVHKILKKRNEESEDQNYSFFNETIFRDVKYLILNETTILMLPKGPVRHYYLDDTEEVMKDRKRDRETSRKLWELGYIR